MNLKDLVLYRLNELDIKPKRSLGQNFLISDHVLHEIFSCVDRIAPQFIIEVGPGLGVLTEQIIAKKIPLQLIEMDSKIFKFWQAREQNIIELDALQFDWSNWKTPHTMVLSNLPYQIGARLVIEISSGSSDIEHMVLMFQKEVAERLKAKPKTKDYSFLSVIVQSYWDIEKVVDAGSSAFYPAPKVDSQVVHLKRKKVAPVGGAEYISFVKQAFQFRRKFMVKSFQKNSKILLEVLAQFGYSNKVRAEEININDFQQIFAAYQKVKHGH